MIYQDFIKDFRILLFSTIFGYILTCRMINIEIFTNYKMSEELINDLAINLKITKNIVNCNQWNITNYKVNHLDGEMFTLFIERY